MSAKQFGPGKTRRPKVAVLTTIDMSLRYLLLDQMRSVKQAGYEVVGISSDGPDVPAVLEGGIRHIAVPISRNFTPLADLRTLWLLYRVMRRERFTIVHTHTPKGGLLGQLAARMARTPVVLNTLLGFYFHENMRPPVRRFYITMEKIAALCSDVILSQNHEDIRTAIREKICPPRKIKFLGNGIQLSHFNPDRYSEEDVKARKAELDIPADAPVVGFVGRLAARRKGFLDFLAAGKALSERLPETRFLIIGEADHGKPDAVEPSVARDYGIEDRCLFLGQRPNTELPLLYMCMDVLVLPSLFEGMPQVVMEAAAMGRPAVVTNVKGNREAVENGRNGLTVPLGNVPALTEAVLDVLTDREKARRMGEEGRRMAEERFDERRIIENVIKEYARLLRKKGLPVPSPREEA